MSDQKTPGDKTLTVSPPKTLTLKRPVEQNMVKQSFSHGRSKSVVVEVKRRVSGDVAPAHAPPPRPAPPAVPPAAPPPPPAAPRPQAPVSQKPGGLVLRTLSADEQDARMRVLNQSRQREAEERRRAEEEASARAAREERERAEREAAASRQREEEARRRVEDDLKRRAQHEAARRLGDEPPRSAPSSMEARPAESRPPRSDGRSFRMDGRPPRIEIPRPPREERPTRDGDRPQRADAARPGASSRPEGAVPRPEGARGPRPGGDAPRGARPGGAPGGPRPLRPGEVPLPADPATPARRPLGSRPAGEDDDRAGVRRRAGAAPDVRVPKSPGPDKSRGRLTLSNALQSDEERMRSVAAFRRRVQRMTGRGHAEQKEKISREVIVPDTITIQELANRMTERAVDVIRFLMKQGQMFKITDAIDADTAQLIAEEFGHTVKRVSESDVVEGLFDAPDADETLSPRPAVVTIMGHVDHGKTSLLDALRKTNVVAGEAGGITQHIGAYQVTTPSGAKVSFIDTPGHAAFTAMRARGAKVTDIVVLVVAANDSVMPQTVEAINHAKAAKVPMIVAINKIDLPDARAERVKTDLIQHGVQVETLGGDVLEVEVSAKTRLNLDKLLEAIALQAEILNLTANPDRPAEGTVIEAKLDRGRGPVATVLVQRGTLKPGDIVVAGVEWGRVRALVGDTGATIREAGPSMPVEVLGFNGTPEAGDRVAVVESEARAREITEYRARQKREMAAARGAAGGSRTLVEMMRDLKEGAGRKEFPLLVKGDVQGSVEAIVGALEKVGNDEVRARVLLSGVGGINESDVTLAQASGAVVIGFNVRANKEARESAERNGVEIRYYNIIYDLVDDVKSAMSGLLAPTMRETMLGTAVMLEIFNITKVGKIAGCRVQEGTIERGQHVRLIRDNTVIHEGKLSTLKRFKDDVKEATAGQECGMSFENYQDIRAGDIVECYRVEEIRRTL